MAIINPTQITPPRVALIDPRTGAISREWYRFFLSLFTAVQNTQDEATIAPDVSSLLASYDSVFSTAIQNLESAPDADSAAANIDAKYQAITQDLALGPRYELGTLSALQQDNVPWLTFDNAPEVIPTAVGSLYWDGGTTLGVQMTSNVLGRLNEDQFYYIKASGAITKGQVVMFTGAVGASGVPTGAPATGVTDGSYIMGVAAENMAHNDFGLVQYSGTLKGIDTSAFADGDILWYDPAVTGGLTKTKPSAPNVKVQMAAVIKSGGGGSGSILIRVNSGSVLGGTDSNVQFGTLATNDLIQYNGTIWANVAPSTVSVGTATNLAGGGANRIPYQTSAGATSFIVAPTIANTFLEWSGSAFQWSSNPLGTVTSVSVVTANGFAGSVATATTTPAITLSTTVTGLVKGNGTAFSAASSGTDYVAPGAITSSGLTMATARLLGRTTAATGAVEEISVAGGLSLSGGVLTSPSGTVTSVSGTGSVNGITLTGTVTSSGSLTLGGTLSNVSLTTQVTGTLPVGNGGLGVATLTSGYLLKGNGTSAVSASVVYDDGTNIVVGGTTTGSSKFTVTGTSSGGQVVARINNTSGTANTQAVLSFDTNGGGFNVRDSQIRSTNNGSNQTTLEFYTANAATPTSKMSISSTGVITAAGVYNNTVGATNRAVYVDNTGLIGYLASVRASKTNIADLTDTGWVYDLHPISFNYRKRDESGAYTDEAETPVEYGLIAEEVETVNPQLVFYDETPEGPSLRGVSYSKLIIPMLAELQALRSRVDELEKSAAL